MRIHADPDPKHWLYDRISSTTTKDVKEMEFLFNRFHTNFSPRISHVSPNINIQTMDVKLMCLKSPTKTMSVQIVQFILGVAVLIGFPTYEYLHGMHAGLRLIMLIKNAFYTFNQPEVSAGLCEQKNISGLKFNTAKYVMV
jgi:hypothetical protein